MIDNNMDYAPFINKLLSLANSKLTSRQNKILTLLVNSLILAMDRGHSCINIEEFCIGNSVLEINVIEVVRLLEESYLCSAYSIGGKIGLKPLALMITNTCTLLYITRYLHYEVYCVKALNKLNQITELSSDIINQQMSLITKHNQFLNEEQLNAIKACAVNKLGFITGGPGTGKTTTVMFLLALLVKLYTNKINIHICAPTGKATNRVKETISSNMMGIIDKFNLNNHEQDVINNISYSTIHKLLGYKRHNIYFKHNENKPLAIDILIIDESSMISLPLFYKLVQAIDSDTIKHVVFLGDKNQLSSVEEGYVFASLMEHSLNKKQDLFSTYFSINNLTISNRNKGGIAKIATAILEGNTRDINKLFKVSNDVKLFKLNFKDLLLNIFNNDSPLNDYMNCILNHNDTDADSLLDIANKFFVVFKKFAILCVTNIGELGINNLNLHIEQFIKAKLNQLGVNNNLFWYTGKPVIILENNTDLKLYNGDIGICIVSKGRPMVVFENGASFIPEVLPNYQLAYAITIHKSQGSEFNHVYILLPNLKQEEILTRELLYTAVTRAKELVTIYSDIDTIYDTIIRVSKRNTGLSYFLV